MAAVTKSLRTARDYKNTLSWSRTILGLGAIIAAWIASGYEETLLIIVILGMASAWATMCHMAEGLVFGRVLNPNPVGPVLLLAALVSPYPVPLLAGALLGVSVYLLLIVHVVARPSVNLMAGKRLYRLDHPLGRLIPFAFLAPEPLSPVFEPIVALYWGVGAFNLPVWRISVFDPPAIHNYIHSRTTRLSSYPHGWNEALTCFRRALGILNLLDTLRRFENADLDGVALAASARLALSAVPDKARAVLREVLKTLRPNRRALILEAFDLRTAPIL